mmetsp:Transcript_20413/g.36585  ORF Transcript_20413/g.36585 Transcript_20413/m.36585 type:complete len:395 (-) Transcript_20413:247-1431(-)
MLTTSCKTVAGKSHLHSPAHSQASQFREKLHHFVYVIDLIQLLQSTEEHCPLLAQDWLSESFELSLDLLISGCALTCIPRGFQANLCHSAAIFEGHRDVLNALQWELLGVFWSMIHIDSGGHVADFLISNHGSFILEIVRLDLAVFQPVCKGERNGVDCLKGACGLSVAQQQGLFEASNLNMLDVIDLESPFGLHLLQSSKSRMCPTACSPLFVVREVYLHALSEISTKLFGIGQMWPVTCEASLGKMSAEAACVGAPMNALLGHGGEVHTTVLPCLRCQVLAHTNGMGHLLVCELQQLANCSCCTWSTPAAGALAWASCVADTNSFTHGNIVAYDHCLQHLFSRAAKPSSHSQDCRDNNCSWMTLRTAVPIIHVKDCGCVGIEKNCSLPVELF